MVVAVFVGGGYKITVHGWNLEAQLVSVLFLCVFGSKQTRVIMMCFID